MKGEFVLILLAAIWGTISVSGNEESEQGWRLSRDDTDEGRDSGYPYDLGGGDIDLDEDGQGSHWRTQRRAYPFAHYELPPPSKVGSRWPWFQSHDTVTERPSDKINGIDEETGVINCPPDVPKCIPRLGRR